MTICHQYLPVALIERGKEMTLMRKANRSNKLVISATISQ